MIDPRQAIRATSCPDCEARGTFGVTMTHTIGGLRCPDCGHVEAARSAPRDVDPFAAREEAREIREVWREETTREGRDVPEGAGGGGNGRRRKKPPKKGDRLAPPGNEPGICWDCGGPTGTSDGRVRYCPECADGAQREAKAERDRRYRERKAGCA